MTNEQLQSFLLLAVSADENAAQIISMDACNYLLRRAENTEFVTFQDGETNINKVQLLLGMFDSLKNNRVLRPLILSWMNEAVGESLYSVPEDDDYLTYSSISSKPSSDADSQASQIATVDTDVAKVKEFGRVIALLEVDEIEKQLKVMNIWWETMPGTWETAQVHVNEIIRKIEALELDYEDSLLRTKAIASFQEETDFQERVRFLRLALRENTTGAVLADSIADESGSTHASSPENGRDDWQQPVPGLYVQNITSTDNNMIALVMAYGGHHTDLMFSSKLDPPSITQARLIERQYIQLWIDEWKTTREMDLSYNNN